MRVISGILSTVLIEQFKIFKSSGNLRLKLPLGISVYCFPILLLLLKF